MLLGQEDGNDYIQQQKKIRLGLISIRYDLFHFNFYQYFYFNIKARTKRKQKSNLSKNLNKTQQTERLVFR